MQYGSVSPPPPASISFTLPPQRGPPPQLRAPSRQPSQFQQPPQPQSYQPPPPPAVQPQPQPQPPQHRTEPEPPTMMDVGVSQPPANILLNELTSQGSNNRAVEEFLRQKGDQPLSFIEYAGVVALLGQRLEEPRSEPFRFSTSTSPEPVPVPAVDFATPGTSSSIPTQNSRKMLNKNPNGNYIYRGGGSSRVATNRYYSPGFGRPSRSYSTIKITPEKTRTDTKRRRTTAGHETVSSQPAQSSGSRGATMTNGSPPVASGSNSTSRTNGVSPSTPRRSSYPTRATAPANPSPLRQAWGQSDSPPQRTPPKRAFAVATLQDIIDKATPKPANPDLQNPYDNSIMPKVAKKPPQRMTRSSTRTQAATEASQPLSAPEAKTIELSEQKIIENTLPKGSKRSRPPPDLRTGRVNGTSSSVSSSSQAGPSRISQSQAPQSQRAQPAANGVNGTSRGARAPAVSVEEVSDDEGGSPSKKQKTTATRSRPTTNGHKPPAASVSVEEVDDVEMSSSQPSVTLPAEVVEPSEASGRGPSPASSSSLSTGLGVRPTLGGMKSSAPKAPSKLRYSFQADKDEKERAPTPSTSSQPSSRTAAAPSLGPAFVPRPSSRPAQRQPATTSVPQDARSIALARDVHELPTFTFVIPASSSGAVRSSQAARQQALARPTASLPNFDLSVSVGFNWGAAGVTQPKKSANGGWNCPTCMLDNTGAQCIACETPRP